jgi:integrase
MVVEALVDVPEGQEGRSSKAMTLGQTVALLKTVESGTHRLAAYVVLSLLVGIRTEEARAITRDEVDVRPEDISDLVGHTSTSVTETVYRHEIRPALTDNGPAMNRIVKANATEMA